MIPVLCHIILLGFLDLIKIYLVGKDIQPDPWSPSGIFFQEINWNLPGFLPRTPKLHLQPTLCDPMNCSPPGSSVHGILQARILESVAKASSRESSWPRDWTWVSYVSCTGRRVLYHQRHLGSPEPDWSPHLLLYPSWAEMKVEFSNPHLLPSEPAEAHREDFTDSDWSPRWLSGYKTRRIGAGPPWICGKVQHPHKKKGALKRIFLMWEEHRDNWRGDERPLSEAQHCSQLTLSHPTLYLYSGCS